MSPRQHKLEAPASASIPTRSQAPPGNARLEALPHAFVFALRLLRHVSAMRHLKEDEAEPPNSRAQAEPGNEWEGLTQRRGVRGEIAMESLFVLSDLGALSVSNAFMAWRFNRRLNAKSQRREDAKAEIGRTCSISDRKLRCNELDSRSVSSAARYGHCSLLRRYAIAQRQD